MTQKKLKAFTKVFREEVYNKAKQIDPTDREDWFSLTLGWAIAKGLEPVNKKGIHYPSEAYEFATFIRYNTDMG